MPRSSDVDSDDDFVELFESDEEEKNLLGENSGFQADPESSTNNSDDTPLEPKKIVYDDSNVCVMDDVIYGDEEDHNENVEKNDETMDLVDIYERYTDNGSNKLVTGDALEDVLKKFKDDPCTKLEVPEHEKFIFILALEQLPTIPSTMLHTKYPFVLYTLITLSKI